MRLLRKWFGAIMARDQKRGDVMQKDKQSQGASKTQDAHLHASEQSRDMDGLQQAKRAVEEARERTLRREVLAREVRSTIGRIER